MISFYDTEIYMQSYADILQEELRLPDWDVLHFQPIIYFLFNNVPDYPNSPQHILM